LLYPLPTTVSLFFFNDPAPSELYPLSLHDALPIFRLVLFPQESRVHPLQSTKLLTTMNFKRAKNKNGIRVAQSIFLRLIEQPLVIVISFYCFLVSDYQD